MIQTPHPDDLARIRDWFRHLSEHVCAVDFAGPRPLFTEDMIAFGTFENFITGRDAAERAQWRNVWPVTTDFRWRMDDIRAIVSADRLSAVGMGVFDSTGYHEDGTPYDRPGRATVAFSRHKIGDDWVADHTHMSLFRDVPTSLLVQSTMQHTGLAFLQMELNVESPVFAGDTVHGECQVIEARRSRSRPDRGLVRTRVRVLKQDGTVALTYTPLRMIKCREGSGPG